MLQAIKDKLKVYSNYLIVGIIILLIISLVRNITRITKVQKKIEKKEGETESLAQKNEELEKQLKKIESTGFIEKQLRDKLGLAKEGEAIIVLPDEETLRALAPEAKKEKGTLPDPNWRKWLDLFL